MQILPVTPFCLLLLVSDALGAVTYVSSNSISSSVSLMDDVLAGISPTGTATREGGDFDTNLAGLGSLTDGLTGTTVSGRSFVNSGTLDYDLGGTFNITNIHFRLVNAVVDDRLSFSTTVEFSYDNGANYSLITSIVDAFENMPNEFATTGVLSSIDGEAVTNVRFNLTNLGTYSASFSEIDVVGSAVPEPSQSALLVGAFGFIAMLRRRTCGKGQRSI